MGTLDGSVKLPGLGDTPKKNVAIAGGVVAAIVGVGYYRKRQADAAVPVAGIDSGITDPSSAFSDTVSGPGDLSGGGGGITTGGDPVPAPINLQNPGILTNSDWKSAGSDLNLGGTDSNIIAGALSKALGGIPMTQAEVEIFQEVCGEIGYPPQTYPPIRLTTTTPGAPPAKATPKPTTNEYSAHNQSMYDVVKIAHPTAGSAAAWNEKALEAIHYNQQHGRNYWPALPGPQLTQRKFTGVVYVI